MLRLLNRNTGSARTEFQWRYFLKAELPILNVGCGNDPMEFGQDAVHLDIEEQRVPNFVKGDCYHLPFPEQDFDTVVLGDILEHIERPRDAVLEAARVARRYVVMTIFEEWRLPGYGCWPDRPGPSGHIWQFTENDIDDLCRVPGFEVAECWKERENEYQGHTWYNWLIALRRTPCAYS